MRSFFSLAIAIILLAGCASQTSPQTYSSGSVGQVNRTIAGQVISAREVDIDQISPVSPAQGVRKAPRLVL